jgi:hypothetical protein
VGLHWPPACLPVPDGMEAGFFVDSALRTWPPRTARFQPGATSSCSGEGSAGTVLGSGRRVATPSNNGFPRNCACPAFGRASQL